jgi:hypothetical protein
MLGFVFLRFLTDIVTDSVSTLLTVTSLGAMMDDVVGRMNSLVGHDEPPLLTRQVNIIIEFCQACDVKNS